MGLFFVGWLLFSIIPAVIASNKGRSGFGWYCLSLVISPLFAGILVACLKPVIQEVEKKALASGMRKCPFCAEIIKAEAKVCRYCQRDLPAEEPPVQPPKKERQLIRYVPDKCPDCGVGLTFSFADKNLYTCTKCGKEFEVAAEKKR